MICANGHEFTERKLLGGSMRCPQCHRESAIRRNKRYRERLRNNELHPNRCPDCQLFPCRCEAL